MSSIIELAAKVGGKKILGAATKGIPGLGQAIAVVEGFKFLVDKKHEAARDKAREILKCRCVQTCPAGSFGNTAITAAQEWVIQNKGCAFKYEGFWLVHNQPGLSVAQATCDVLRWDDRRNVFTKGDSRYQGTQGIEPCRICFPPDRSKSSVTTK